MNNLSVGLWASAQQQFAVYRGRGLCVADSAWPLVGWIMFKRTDRVNCRKMRYSAGVQPVFLSQKQAIDYAKGRACFRSGEIRVMDSGGAVERVIPFSEANRNL
jgi:hypothetical protein